ncbi:maleylpyruvate isomerase [Duganella sp. SG902]|uniref:maleylacetoacetate isomerase n=1 Tax=Duganella sp. SG902 TaxID=2587016 RepID=UPI00159D5F7B|nr:maleylacetoacetate isomerase [Duganella sp. SG902]NVM78420.1 maleylpyruvate isomerase [Duganella sp. SG902]
MPESATQLVLHNYFRSSSAYRVRIALGLKGLPYAYLPVHLNRNGGEQFQPAFSARNPQQLVPVLSDGALDISQSLAIIEYLDEAYPETPLLPATPGQRARVRQLALSMACDIHPLNNLRVLKYITGTMGQDEAAKDAWIQHWHAVGLAALEADLARDQQRGRYCVGDTPTMADCCLVPQLFAARRFGMDLTPFPTLQAIDAACQRLPAFQRAHPGCQPDSE